MCKLDLKDAYFCIPLSADLKKYVRFHQHDNLYQFLCLSFYFSSFAHLSISNFYQTLESVSSLPSSLRDSNRNVPKRQANYRQVSRRDSSQQGYSNPFVA